MRPRLASSEARAAPTRPRTTLEICLRAHFPPFARRRRAPRPRPRAGPSAARPRRRRGCARVEATSARLRPYSTTTWRSIVTCLPVAADLDPARPPAGARQLPAQRALHPDHAVALERGLGDDLRDRLARDRDPARAREESACPASIVGLDASRRPAVAPESAHERRQHLDGRVGRGRGLVGRRREGKRLPRGEQLGATVYELGPGNFSVYHFHHAAEEMLVVLDGEMTMKTEEGERPCERGEVVIFPVGPAGAHGFRNDGDGTCRYLMASTRPGARGRGVPGARPDHRAGADPLADGRAALVHSRPPEGGLDGLLNLAGLEAARADVRPRRLPAIRRGRAGGSGRSAASSPPSSGSGGYRSRASSRRLRRPSTSAAPE